MTLFCLSCAYMVHGRKTKIKPFLSFRRSGLSFARSKLSRPSSTDAALRAFPSHSMRSMCPERRSGRVQPSCPHHEGGDSRASAVPRLHTAAAAKTDAACGLALLFKIFLIGRQNSRGPCANAHRGRSPRGLGQDAPAVEAHRAGRDAASEARSWGPDAPLRGAVISPRDLSPNSTNRQISASELSSTNSAGRARMSA